MKVLMVIFVFLNITLMAQISSPNVYVKFPSDKVLFYQEQPSSLILYVEKQNKGILMPDMIKQASNVKSVEQGNKDNYHYYKVEFVNPLTVELAKQFFKNIHLSEIYTPTNKKIYIDDMLTQNEIESFKNMPLQTFKFSENIGNTNHIDYYNFKVFNLESKIQSLYSNNYPHHLFSGNVAVLKDKLMNAKLERDNFVQRNNR